MRRCPLEAWQGQDPLCWTPCSFRHWVWPRRRRRPQLDLLRWKCCEDQLLRSVTQLGLKLACSLLRDCCRWEWGWWASRFRKPARSRVRQSAEGWGWCSRGWPPPAWRPPWITSPRWPATSCCHSSRASSGLQVRVAEVVPKSLDLNENFKPEHTLFCRQSRFVAIYALFGDLWAKRVLFWVKNGVSWARSALLHGKYCIFYWVKFANLLLRTKTTHLSRKL